MVSALIVSAFSQVFLKKSAQKQHTSVLKEYLNVYVIIGYGMMALTTVLTVLAYGRGLDYKNGPVIESLGYVLIMIFSLVFFGEKITKRKLLGNILVIIGIIVFYI